MECSNKLCLIDGDFILWKVVPNIVPSETERMYGVSFDKTLEETLALLDWYMKEKIFIPTKVNRYIGFLGGIGNFRKELSIQYKKDRSEERPNFFREAKHYLIDKYNFVLTEDMESEDAVGISLTKYPDSIIVREDHDLDQLPGVHYNPTKQEWKTISKEDAVQAFWLQMLTGCTTDNVKGVPKVGIVGATKLLTLNSTNSWEYSQVEWDRFSVLHKYIEYFGEYKGIEEFYLNYKLLKILREKEGFIIPEIRELQVKTQEDKPNIDNVTF